MLTHLLQEATNTHADHIALRIDDRCWTYAELDRLTETLARSLAARGIRAGDRVAFLLPNGAELVFVNLACLKLGAVAVPMNVRLLGPELAYLLEHCGARLCIAHATLYPNLASVRSQLASIEAFFIVGADSLPPAIEDFSSLLQGDPPAFDRPVIAATAPATILYTSGTTARPKGVTHTYRGLANTVTHYTRACGMRSDDVVLGMLSMGHVFGYTLQLLSPLSVGATVVVMPSFERARVLDHIARHKVTHLYGLPVMFDALTQHPQAVAADTGSLRYCLAGGDAVSPALNLAMRAVLGLELHEGCGMTEVIPYALNRPGMENRIGSIGQSSVGMHLRVVNDAGNDVLPGESGEIWVRSDALMAGYWNDPTATAVAIRDGWFRTGDVGRCDEDGYYWFVGRSKEIIVRGGSNISPLEVEAALSLHPAVREVAVVGMPHASLGETVAAFVVLNNGFAVAAPDLINHAGMQIAAYKVPERIEFLPELPRNATGKVMRKVLKQRIADGDPSRCSG